MHEEPKILTSVVQRKDRDGYWIRARWTDPTTGRRPEKWKRFDRERDALEGRDDFKLEILRELEAKPNAAAPDRSVKTVRELCAWYRRAWVKEPERDKDGIRIRDTGLAAWRSVEYHVQAIEDELGDLRLDYLTFDAVKDFRIRLLAAPTPRRYAVRKAGRKVIGTAGRRRRGASYANRICATLRRMCNLAEKKGWLRENPFDTRGKDYEPRVLIDLAAEPAPCRILEPDEEARIFRALRRFDHSETDQRVHLRHWITLMLEAGFRANELLTLKWGAVDWKRGELRPERADVKGQAETTSRRIPISRRAEAALREREEMYRLTHDGRKPPAGVRIFDYQKPPYPSWYRILKEANVTPIRFHDLRGTWASRAAHAVSETEIQKMFGQKERSEVIARYIKISEATMTRTRDVLDGYAERLEEELAKPPADVVPITKR